MLGTGWVIFHPNHLLWQQFNSPLFYSPLGLATSGPVTRELHIAQTLAGLGKNKLFEFFLSQHFSLCCFSHQVRYMNERNNFPHSSQDVTATAVILLKILSSKFIFREQIIHWIMVKCVLSYKVRWGYRNTSRERKREILRWKEKRGNKNKSSWATWLSEIINSLCVFQNFPSQVEWVPSVPLASWKFHPLSQFTLNDSCY